MGKVERRRREDRGAEGAEEGVGCGVWGGDVPTDSYFEKSKFPIASITIRRERNS